MTQRYHIRTFGCQMNKHDSERMAGLLEAAGYEVAPSVDEADVVVFNTCCVREHADERLVGQVASLKALKTAGHDVLIAVGGCLGQRDGVALLRALPHVDVVFGTHNVASLPSLLDAARQGRGAVVETVPGTDTFASDLPLRREHPWRAWVSVTVGCDNHCAYCIVPSVRGPERSRPLGSVLSEVAGLAEEGVAEVTLLGQNVNSYGRDLYGQPRFAELLRGVASSGIPWVRFLTSHPKDLSDATIAAIAEEPSVCRYLHLPLQSGSDAVLAAMNRRYTQEDYVALVERIRAAIPDIALSTDIIVGFPGETEADFAETMRVVEHVGFDQAFTFLYSPRSGTPAAEMPHRVESAAAHDRFERLVAAVQRSALERNLRYVDTRVRVLFEGASRRDPTMLIGRTATNKVVHAPAPSGEDAADYAGVFGDVEIEDAQTWFLTGRHIGPGSGRAGTLPSSDRGA